MDTSQALEMAACAEINMKNVEKMAPELRLNTVFALAKAQIRICIEELEKDE